MEKQRHGFVTFWLWLMLLSNLAVAIYMIAERDLAIWIYATEEKAHLMFYGIINGVDLFCNSMIVLAGLGVVNFIAAILLLKWKKAGFWVCIAASAINLIVMIILASIGGLSSAVISSIIGAIAGPLVLYGILQLKKNDVSCWKQLM